MAPDEDDASHLIDAFEFYPCLVDEAAASIYVNLRFEAGAPAGATTRYTVAVAMRAAGEHGIGTADEAEAVNAVEEAVIARAGELAVTYVGRIRTRGIWETVLYGPAGHLEALRAAANAGADGRRLIVRDEHDPAWRYYHELLLPDAERRRWMDDRRLVQILAEQGDRLTAPRRVDHLVEFPAPAARAAFLAALPAGFVADAGEGNLARVHRVDPIELDHIHDVVMILVAAAASHGGTYVRWEAAITST